MTDPDVRHVIGRDDHLSLVAAYSIWISFAHTILFMSTIDCKMSSIPLVTFEDRLLFLKLCAERKYDVSMRNKHKNNTYKLYLVVMK